MVARGSRETLGALWRSATRMGASWTRMRAPCSCVKPRMMRVAAMAETAPESPGVVMFDSLDRTQQRRAPRAADDAEPQEAARIDALQADARTQEARLRVLLTRHAGLRQTFEAALAALTTTSSRLAGVEHEIDTLRQALDAIQQALGAHALDLPPLTYQALNVWPTVARRLGR